MNDLDRRQTPNHPLAPDEATTVDECLPGGWERRRFEFTGNFRLRAAFELPSSEDDHPAASLSITPWKSYDDQPGFPDCHSVKLIDRSAGDDPAVTVRGRTPSETEYVADALDIAQELMEGTPDEDACEVGE